MTKKNKQPVSELTLVADELNAILKKRGYVLTHTLAYTRGQFLPRRFIAFVVWLFGLHVTTSLVKTQNGKNN